MKRESKDGKAPRPVAPTVTHLNLLPRSKERRNSRCLCEASLPSQRPSFFFLSLSQRERIKVRNCYRRVRQAQTKLLARRYRVLRELDDSKIAKPQFLRRLETVHAYGLSFDRADNYVHHHPAQSRVWQQDNKNLGRNDQLDVVAEICNQRIFDFEDASTECARSRLPSSGERERDSQTKILIYFTVSRKDELAPHLNPLPRPGRGEDCAGCTK
jgi:hypothetical protein